LAAADTTVATAIVSAVQAMDPTLAILAISGTALEHAARAGRRDGLPPEIFADRAYLPNGQLVPRSVAGAVLHDARAKPPERLVGYLKSGRMPVMGADPHRLGGRLDLRPRRQPPMPPRWRARSGHGSKRKVSPSRRS
jgi:UPF0271 protein